MNSMRIRSLLAITLAAALAACGSAAPPDPTAAAPSSEQVVAVKPQPGAVKRQVATQALGDPTNLEIVPTLHYLTPEVNAPMYAMLGGNSMMVGKTGSDLENLAVDDFLNAGITATTPYGLLKRVTKVTDSGSYWTVEVVDATMDEVVVGGRINQEAGLDPSLAIESNLGEGVIKSFPLSAQNIGRESKPKTVKYSFIDKEVVCGNGGGKVKLNGYVEGQFSVYMDTDWEKYRITRAPKLNKPKLFDAGVKFEGKTQIKLSGKCSLAVGTTIPIAQESLPGVEFGYWPFFSVGVKPLIKVSVGANGELFVESSYSYTYEGKRKDGVHWDRDSGWKSVSESTGIDGKENFSYAAGLRVRAFASVAVGLKFYAEVLTFDLASADVYVEVKPYIELLAKIPPPSLCLYAGMDASLNANVSVLTKEIKAWKRDYPDVYRKELVCAVKPEDPKPPVVMNAPCENISGACTFDTRALMNNYPGVGFIESIAAYGKIWNYDLNGKPVGGNGTRLADVPRYRNGPCASVPAGQNCVLDTRTLVDFPGVGYVESITAYGKYYNYDLSGNEWIGGGNGNDLRSVARYANGPCAFAPAGQPCAFDTRVLADYPGVGFLETITAYGHFWNFDINGNEWIGGGNGMDLKAVARFASGPCAPAVASGQPCVFDTFAIVDYPGVGYVQSITAYGKAYNYDLSGNEWAGNGTNLKSVLRFTSGSGIKDATDPLPPVVPAKTVLTYTRFANPCAPDLTAAQCEAATLYTEILGRQPEFDVHAWSSPLTGTALRRTFAYSAEAQSLINTMSKACLLRGDDQGLINAWSELILQGRSIIDAANIFAGAEEARAKGSPCQIVVNPG